MYTPSGFEKVRKEDYAITPFTANKRYSIPSSQALELGYTVRTANYFNKKFPVSSSKASYRNAPTSSDGSYNYQSQPIVANHRLYVSSYDGVIVFENEPSLVQRQDAQQPSTFELMQNVPNPFNPTTRIEFNMPKDGHVILTVYDLLGREVITLVDEKRNAGKHEARFDGSALTSGLYFYCIETDQFTKIRKMVLVFDD